MDVSTRIRLGMTAVVAAAASCAIALAGTVEAGAPAPPLLPDLKTVAPGPKSLYMKHSDRAGKTVLRIANRVANKGAGPLELYALPATDGDPYDCNPGEKEAEPDRDAVQRIFGDDDEPPNGYDPDDPELDASKVGCFEYHTKHAHWHFQDFARFSLLERKSGEQVVPPSRKIGFCIVDTGGRKYPDLPGSPPNGVYPERESGGCGLGSPTGGPGIMGLSVGYADLYTASTPGQRLDITGVGAGRYCLVSFANPAGGQSQLTEATDANNDRRREVRVNPAKRVARFTGEGCSPTPD